MTILFFCRLFYPHIGGVEKHVLEVGKRLVEKRNRVIVVTEDSADKKTTKYQLKYSSAKLTGKFEGIEIYRIPVGNDNWFKKFRIWWELWKLREVVKVSDVIHCHDVFFWHLPFRFLYPTKPVYTTFHGYETKFPPSKKAIIIRKISEKLSWGNICVGDFIRKWYGTRPTYVTYGGVDIKNQISKIKYQKYKSKIKVVFIGRLEEDIGILTYLKVLDILMKKKIGFEFEACGDGSLRKSVEKYGKLHGFVRGIDKYIERVDIVFSSSYLSILQTLSQKKLVVAAYDNPLKEDYLKMSPFAKWIIIENSPRELAEKILYFIKHQDEKEKIANEAYGWIKVQAWDKVVDIYLNLWRSKDINY